MAEWLDKQKSLFQRDEQGNLLSVEVTLELLEDKPKAMIMPMSRGKILAMRQSGHLINTSNDQDVDLIVEQCINPKFTKEEAILLKPKVLTALSMAILATSLDIPQVELQEMSIKKAIEMNEDILKKKNI